MAVSCIQAFIEAHDLNKLFEDINHYTKDEFIALYDLKINYKRLVSTLKSKYGFVRDKAAANEKRRRTCLEKYGVDSIVKTQQFKDKYTQTCLENYGTSFSTQAETVKAKIKESVQQHYGVDNISQAESVKTKKAATCMDHYGVTNYFASAECQQLSKNALVEKYGVESVFALPEVQAENKVKIAAAARSRSLSILEGTSEFKELYYDTERSTAFAKAHNQEFTIYSLAKYFKTSIKCAYRWVNRHNLQQYFKLYKRDRKKD